LSKVEAYCLSQIWPAKTNHKKQPIKKPSTMRAITKYVKDIFNVMSRRLDTSAGKVLGRIDDLTTSMEGMQRLLSDESVSMNKVDHLISYTETLGSVIQDLQKIHANMERNIGSLVIAREMADSTFQDMGEDSRMSFSWNPEAKQAVAEAIEEAGIGADIDLFNGPVVLTMEQADQIVSEISKNDKLMYAYHNEVLLSIIQHELFPKSTAFEEALEAISDREERRQAARAAVKHMYDTQSPFLTLEALGSHGVAS